VNPCNELPLATHDVYAYLQTKCRVDRPFHLDLEAISLATRFDRETVRDGIADLVDVEVLRISDDRYVLISGCTCPVERQPRITSPTRKPPRAYRLAMQFADAVALLAPMGIGNASALSKNIATWIRGGTGEEAVELMIAEFAHNFPIYCSAGFPPWKAFVGRRHQIMDVVQKHYMDQHQWDEGFEERFAAMFPKVLVKG
jgi:hypothetical protein